MRLPPPPFEGDAADPFVFPVPATGEYLLVTTEVAGVNVPMRRSADLGLWSEPADALPRLPPWVLPGRTWAPTIVEVDGGYVLHATARARGGEQQCLLTAWAQSAEGPYTPDPEPLEQPRGGTWALDGSPYRDPTGDLWLTWKSDLRRGAISVIYCRRLDDTGRRWARRSKPRELLRSGAAWEGDVVEAPCLVEVEGSTWLLYSGNRWETDRYAVGLAECSAGPNGPARKLTVDRPWIASTEGAAGPGGQEMFTTHDGKRMLALHAWHPEAVGYDRGGVRSLRLIELRLAN
jgi:hypothetical protein